MQYIEVRFRRRDGSEGSGLFKVWRPERLAKLYYRNQLVSAAKIAVVPVDAVAIDARIAVEDRRPQAA